MDVLRYYFPVVCQLIGICGIRMTGEAQLSQSRATRLSISFVSAVRDMSV